MTDKPNRSRDPGREIDPVAHQRGVVDAQADIAAKTGRLFWGTRGAWGDLFTELMQKRFGVQVIHISDMTRCERWSYEQGYNDTIKSHLDSDFGAGSFDRTWNEIQEYRQESYRKWLESQTNSSENGKD